jgi:hydroxypyruvate isomerase
MGLALSMWSMHRTVEERDWTVIDFVKYCRQTGIEEVELLSVFWKDIDHELEQVISYMKEEGLRASSYAVTNNFVIADENARKAALQEIIKGIDIAQKLDTSILRVFAGNLIDGISKDEGFEWILEGLSKAAAAAEQSGIILCIENHGKLAGKGIQIKEIIEKVGSGALRSTFDVGNFLLVDENTTEAAKILLPYIQHVHLKDFKQNKGGEYSSLSGKKFDGVAIGEGDVDIATVIDMLKGASYQGAYVLEYEGTGSEMEGIQRCFDHYRSLTGKLG